MLLWCAPRVVNKYPTLPKLPSIMIQKPIDMRSDIYQNGKEAAAHVSNHNVYKCVQLGQCISQQTKTMSIAIHTT